MIDLKNWGVMRVVRLVAGGLILWSALANQQPILGILGGFLALQAVLNTGCGATGCRMPITRRTTGRSAKEINYEEVH